MVQPKRKDLNQSDMEKILREAGFSVQSLHSLGKGVPDLLLGLYGLNILIEVKHGNAGLTEPEAIWHKGWNGQVRIAQTPEEVLIYLSNHAQTMKRWLDSISDHCEIELRKLNSKGEDQDA